MTPAIVVDDVSKRYRLYHERNQTLKSAVMRGRRAGYEEFWALQGVSFNVGSGETFGIIGENGSGKSTLLKCMARILRPDSGSIRVTGKMSALLELGAGFHPELSGRENIFLNGSILGMTKRELTTRFDDIVAFAGLERFIDTPVKNYSSGMYVRLGFSVAINVDPDVLLVDEVLAVGDEQFQRRCMEKFADLRRGGRTVVIVSHSLPAMRNMCDRLAWIEKGHLKSIGPPGQVVDDYIAVVHEVRPTDVAVPPESRVGSGEAVIERVELLDDQLHSTTQTRTGDAVTFRLHYAATEPIPKPVFRLAIFNIDGIQISGPNTRDAGYLVEQIDGRGHVDLIVDRLLLVPGTYDIGVALLDNELLHEYDFQQRALRFDVEAGDPRELEGFVSLGGRWKFE